ncbi:N-acetyltransferase GCN5 protein [Haloplasma contractile SSD-17B]|uniref:N-acetyltransferase GCN5 protein n=1 Tax=Haloplasma contractile SSD-17B TaxID=1033810 RepID=U2FFK3_9MOLU|nr:N-acetyltransferase GCN5 protein [Haloplasma contractile SSD-17B]
MVIELSYESNDFDGVSITNVIQLSPNGIVKQHYKVCAHKEVKGLKILQGVNHVMSNGFLPYDHQIIEMKHYELYGISHYNFEKLSENWLFSTSKDTTKALTWPKDYKPIYKDFCINFEHNIGTVMPEDIKETKPIMVALNTFTNWREFRNYATGQKHSKYINEVDDIEVTVNNTNPFTNHELSVIIKEHKQHNLKGEFSLHTNESVEQVKKKLIEEDGKKETVLNMTLPKNFINDVFTISLDLPAKHTQKKQMVFKTTNQSISTTKIKDGKQDVLIADNGLMTIKSCPSFSPALFSLNYKNREWLDTSYPTPKPKSWFNPYVGGIMSSPEELQLRTILQEDIKGRFVTKVDSKGNEWQGIKTEFSVTGNDEFRGLIIHEYYLMLPGVPVLCHTAKVANYSGKLFSKDYFEAASFFTITGDDYVIARDKQGEKQYYKVGSQAVDFFTQGSILFGNENREEHIQVVSNKFLKSNIMMINPNDNACYNSEPLTIPNGDSLFTAPVFYLFTESFIEEDYMKDLVSINFNV